MQSESGRAQTEGIAVDKDRSPSACQDDVASVRQTLQDRVLAFETTWRTEYCCQFAQRFDSHDYVAGLPPGGWLRVARELIQIKTALA